MRILIITLLLAGPAFAAIPKKLNPEIQTLSALKQKPDQRVAILKKQGKDAIKNLRSIAFGEQHVLETRWKALMTLTMIAGPEAAPELEAALKHRDWFMRDAGLKALAKVAPEKARPWARKLLNDPALVVRSSAVATIRKLNDLSAKGLLWEKLYAPNNFRGKQSLWVRRHITETLQQFADKGDETRFIKVLNDSDVSLHKSATSALRKLTGITPAVKGKGLQSEVQFWKDWSVKR